MKQRGVATGPGVDADMKEGIFTMLTSCLRRLAGSTRRREKRRSLAERILARLHSAGRVTLDKTVLRDLGTSQAKALPAICDLLLAEKLHLRSDREDRLLILTNQEFGRTILEEADQYVTESMVEEKIAPLRVVVLGEENLDPASEASELDSAEAVEYPTLPVFSMAPSQSDGEYDWFLLDMVEMDQPEILPMERQTLPPRPRQAYVAYDETRAQSGYEKK